MKKVNKNPSTALLPVPSVLITAQKNNGRPNIITIAWTGILSSKPPLVYISLRPSRYTYSIIKASGEYCINIPSENLYKEVDYCGVVSGRNTDKFKETGLTPLPSNLINAPLIKECPVNMECRVKDVLPLGSHDMFIAEVLTVHYNENVLKENGKPDIGKIKPLSLCLREYRSVAKRLGVYGLSGK